MFIEYTEGRTGKFVLEVEFLWKKARLVSKRLQHFGELGEQEGK